MPKSIFDVLDEYYYNSGQREQSYQKNPVNLAPKKLFQRARIKPGLDTVQKIIVYSFLMRLNTAKDIAHQEITIF
jgi:hypothetical protein